MAAGITVARAALGRLRAYLEDALAAPVAAARGNDALAIDGALSAGGATVDFVTQVARAGPYGAGNPEPVFALPRHTIVFAEELAGGHVRARLRAGDGSALPAIAFRAAGQPLGRALLESRGAALHIAGTLSIDRWQGSERVQFRISDAAAVVP
jgi:single-stranded-DNA-specific exonuclease